jgi:hypothetical protein
LQARRDVDHVADRGEIVERAFADVADEGLAVVEADPNLDEGALLTAITDLGEQLARLLQHRLRRILEPAVHRQVERHHLVADQLVDDRLREEDSLRAGVEAAQQGADRLGIGLLGEPGEPTQVGEEDADLGRHPTRRRRLDAGIAEGRVLARGAVAEGLDQAAAEAGEGRAADSAAGARRERPEQPHPETTGATRHQSVVGLPILGGKRLAFPLARRSAHAAEVRALPERQPIRAMALAGHVPIVGAAS